MVSEMYFLSLFILVNLFQSSGLIIAFYNSSDWVVSILQCYTITLDIQMKVSIQFEEKRSVTLSDDEKVVKEIVADYYGAPCPYIE